MDRGSNSDTSAVPRCGLYVHVPFCETKCGYCDFFSVALKGRNPAPLVERLLRELRWRTEGIDSICTVFVGGGTPTLLPPELLEALLAAIGKRVKLDELEEFTVEANPATVDDAKAHVLVAAGVSRVSMGAQSFHPAELATLERLHSPGDIAPSVATLRKSGVSQINLDLIFGIPGQTMETWLESIRRAIDLGPDHLACYGLTYEPATPLTALKATGRLTPCDEDLEAEMFLATMETLERAGYRQYEISNYAKPGCESKHNLIYWRNEPYIGVGPSAAGCMPLELSICDCRFAIADSVSKSIENRQSTIDNQTVSRRYKNVADIAGYVRMMDERGHAEAESETIQGETLMLEMILMQLRLNQGLSINAFTHRTRCDPRLVFADALDRLSESGILTCSDTHVALTRQGFLKANHVMGELAASMRSPTSLLVW